MVADDLDDPQRGDGQDHAGYPPDQVTGKQHEDGENRVDVDLGLHDQGRDDIKLNRLDQCVGYQYAHHHVEASALRKGHETGERTTRHISYKGNNFQDSAKDGEEEGIMYPYKRKSYAVHDPQTANDHRQSQEILLDDLCRLGQDDLCLSFRVG